VPFLKDCLQPLAQEFALRGGLNTEIADQATAIPFGSCQYAADAVQVALQSLPGRKGLVVQSRSDRSLEVGKIAVQHFPGKGLLGAEVIGEGTVRSASGCTDIPHRRPLVSGVKHHLEAGVENVFAKGWLAHREHNTYVRIE
jgi:hypothetical protein